MLKLKNIEKIFHENTPSENIALSGANLTIHEGDFITIVGSNGAGKSTLLNSIAGVFKINEGKILLNDKDISGQAEYERAKYIGRVFQNPLSGTSPEMTIEENLSLAFSKSKNLSLKWGLNNYKRNIFKNKLKKISLGLEDRLDIKVKLLSGGQRQALTLSMATMTKPQLLLLDEHTAALDPATAIKINNLTRELVKENNITTLMITHNMEDAINIGNRLIMMDEGNIILDISGKEKNELSIDQLLQMFHERQGKKYSNDRTLLSM